MTMTVAPQLCAPSTFSLPSVPGTEILNITASLVQNHTTEVSEQYYYNHPSSSVQGLDYCNVTVSYTHPGQDDYINVETWLPLDTWNDRLQAIGGGGYIAGRFFLSYTGMSGAIGEGYAATTTDAGLYPQSYIPDSWAQVSPSNVDLYTLQNFASVALNDQAIIAKAVIKEFYGRPPKYSYWSGCSQGGRQGYMLAQRYPNAYDGIAAAAPAIHWSEFIASTSWAQVTMNSLGEFPYPCELDAITTAAITHCDGLDGVEDGLVSDADRCDFNPHTLVGKVINCTQTGKRLKISPGAATIAKLTWDGPSAPDGTRLWYGPESQSRLTGDTTTEATTSDLGFAMTDCANGTCKGVPTGLGEPWLKYWVNKDPEWNYTLIKTVEDYERYFHSSIQEFNSIIGTSDPDLTRFRDAGGKLITYHGLADGLIPERGTTHYYDLVSKITPDVHDYYRYFKVPGLAHCSGGKGGQPTETFKALVDWVEAGVAPTTLPISFNDTNGVRNDRILCPYPEKAQLKSGFVDVTSADAFECTK